MVGILDRKTRILDAVVTEIGRRNMATMEQNHVYFSAGDSDTYYSGSYDAQINIESPSKTMFDRLSLADPQWKSDFPHAYNKNNVISKYEIEAGSTMFNSAEDLKYLQNVEEYDPDSDKLGSLSGGMDDSIYSSVLQRMSMDVNKFVLTRFRDSDDDFELSGAPLVDDDISDKDPLTSWGIQSFDSDKYPMTFFKFDGAEYIKIDDVLKLPYMNYVKSFCLNYKFLPPLAIRNSSDVTQIIAPGFFDTRGSSCGDLNGNPNWDEIKNAILYYLLGVQKVNLVQLSGNEVERDRTIKIEVYEIYSETVSNNLISTKTTALDIIKISDQFWLIGKFKAPDYDVIYEDLSEKKFLPIFGAIFV